MSRSSYAIPPAVFSELPSVPTCFSSVVSAYQRRSFTDDSFFTPSYYLQPEFFPGFEQNGLPQWKSPVPAHYGAVGFGYFPPEKVIRVPRGSTVHFRFFIHSGFGVRSYQGMRLIPEFSVSTHSDSIHISLDENSQKGFLLGPTFPKFSSLWVKPVDGTISLDPDAPVGTIRVNLRTASPLSETKDSWPLPPDLLYYDATSFVGEQVIFPFSIISD